jgi:hypothetical protein
MLKQVVHIIPFKGLILVLRFLLATSTLSERVISFLFIEFHPLAFHNKPRIRETFLSESFMTVIVNCLFYITASTALKEVGEGRTFIQENKS